MNPTYRSTAHTDYGTGTQNSKTIAKPSGLAVDDILLAVLHLEPPTLQTITATGFTVLKSALTSSGSNDQQMTVLWKRATSSDVAAANFTFNWTTSVYNTGDLHAIAGCITTTSPFSDNAILPVSSAGSTTINSVSYAGAAGLGVWAFTDFNDGGTITVPSGYATASSSADGDLRLAYRTDTTATTSTGTGTHSVGTANYVVFAGTLIPPAQNMISNISDSFDDNSPNTNLWAPYGSFYSETGGRLVVTPPSNGGFTYAGYLSVNSYDLTSSHVFVQCVQGLNTAAGCEMYLYTKLDTSNYYCFILGNGTLLFRSMVGGTADDSTSIAYNAATMQWWRIREQSGTIYWETSGDRITWTSRKTISNTLTITAMKAELSAGTYQNVASPGSAIFDNFNIYMGSALVAWFRG